MRSLNIFLPALLVGYVSAQAACFDDLDCTLSGSNAKCTKEAGQITGNCKTVVEHAAAANEPRQAQNPGGVVNVGGIDSFRGQLLGQGGGDPGTKPARRARRMAE